MVVSGNRRLREIARIFFKYLRLPSYPKQTLKNCYLLGSSRGCSTHTWANKSSCIVTQERETDEAQDGLSEDNHVDKNEIDRVLA